MVQRVSTVAFEGIEARAVDVQVQVAPVLPAFNIVGLPDNALNGFTVLGELGLDGSIAAVAGALPAAIGANSRGEGLICPAASGPEAAWASPDIQIIAASSLIQIANHFKGTQVLSRPQPKVHEPEATH